MEYVPHWQWLVVLYFLIVAIPVWLIHSKLRTILIANRNFKALLIYFFAVVGTAFLMHFIAMFLYFRLIFTR